MKRKPKGRSFQSLSMLSPTSQPSILNPQANPKPKNLRREYLCALKSPQLSLQSKSSHWVCFWSIYIWFFELKCAAIFYHCVGCSQESLFVFLAVAWFIMTCVGCGQPLFAWFLAVAKCIFSFLLLLSHFYPSTSNLLHMQLKCGPLV